VDTAVAHGLSRAEPELALSDELLAAVVVALRPGAPPSTGAMRQHCAAHRELIEGWLREGCPGPKTVRLLARHTGVTVPLRTLQRFISDELVPPSRGRTVRVVDPPPGESIEVDFLELGSMRDLKTGKTRKLSALLCIAGYSRHLFLWPCWSQQLDDVIDGLEGAWDFFGGVFPVVISDNLKAVVTESGALSRKLNAGFTEYMQTRDFELEAARIYKPKDKARVERQVRYARNDFFRGEQFGDLEEVRGATAVWCREVAGVRTHGTTQKRPLEVFDGEELPLLEPAPESPYDTPVWSTLKVGRDGVVVVDKSMYSVPYRLAESKVRTKLTRTTLKIYRGAELVKLHVRLPPGQSSLDPVDYPVGKAELATRDVDTLIHLAEAYGEAVGEYARRLIECPLPWTRIRHLYTLTGLAKRHGASLTNEACARSLELGVVEVVRIKRMLERGLVRHGVLSSPPSKRPPGKVVSLRFSRASSEWRASRSSEGGPSNAPA
jgi:transposase